MTQQITSQIVTLVLIFLFVLLPACALLNYLSRKFGADLQARIGPNRAGPAGSMQPIADVLKSLQKEDAAASAPVSQQVFLALQSALLLSSVTVLPLSSALLLLDADMSAFLALWVALGAAMISLIIGFRQKNMPGWLAAVRIAAQTVAAAFPALLTVLCAGAHAGSFRWTRILASQGAGPFSWTIFSSPFAPFALGVFVVSGLMVFSVPPMASGMSRPELSGGITSLWGGRNLALSNFMRFYGFFLWSCMAVALFLGGWLIPQGLQDALGGNHIQTVLEVVTLLVKSFALMLLVRGVAYVIPRTRTDQITSFSWRVLSPVALAALVGSSLWKVWFS